MSGGVYHLSSLGILLLVSYALSLVMVRKQLVARQQHRKIWNYLLLIFFLSTALLGLLLVVKVNYKLDIQWIEEAMQWHVDSGIGFALVALFHLSWHFRYYTGSKAQTSVSGHNAEITWNPYLGFTALQEKTFFILLGYISIMAQLVLLREFIKSFHGNELVIAVFLAIWMILTALGARTGAAYQYRIGKHKLFRLLLVIAALPLFIHLLLLLVNRLVFLPGFQPGMIDSFIIMLILTALYATVSGFLFGFVSKAQGKQQSGAFHYRLDSLGSLTGGVFFGLVLVHFLNNLQLLTLLFLSTVLVVVRIYEYPRRGGVKYLLILVGILMFVLSLFPELANQVEGLRYRQEKLIQYKDTPYGSLSITSRNEQLSAYLDGNPVISSADLTVAEESVHFPALQHARPKSILLMGGGLSGNIAEAAKYKPERIDYCEADPWIFSLGKVHFTEQLPDVLHFIPRDGRSWLMESAGFQYDVIVSSAKNPVTIGWNRYFTLEFYREVKRHLSHEGVFCMQLAAAGNYVNSQGTRLLSINYHTLKEVFPHVIIVPGTSSYFLASRAPLSLDFPALLEHHSIQTTYVHPDYLDAMHMQFDSDQLTQRIVNEEARINQDLRPSLFFASLMELEARMGQHSMQITGIISTFLFLLLWLIYPPVKSALFISGFTGAGIQILLIMLMQSFYGYAYLVAPMMITVFMGGIVCGTLLWKRIWKKASMHTLIGLVGLMALLSALGFLLLRMETLFDSRFSGQVILGVLNFTPGMLLGALFAMALNLNVNSKQNSTGMLYSADLTGAALGTLIPVMFLLPLTGVMNTFILFCGINVITALYLLIRGTEKQK